MDRRRRLCQTPGLLAGLHGTEAILLVGGVVVFGAGLAAVFIGVRRVRPRLAGLATMAVGALLSLAAADPASPTTWWMLVTSAATLVGLLAFAAAVERWIAATRADPSAIDDDPAT